MTSNSSAKSSLKIKLTQPDSSDPGPSGEDHAEASPSGLNSDNSHPPLKSSLSYSSQGGHSPTGNRPSKGCSVQISEPPARERRGTDTGKADHKRGLLYNAIPSMPLPVAILCCILNIVIPGSGTLISCFMVFCCGTTTRCGGRGKAFCLNLLTAVLQCVTFIFIVGWVWSITWGMAFVQLALSTEKEDTAARSALPYYVRRHSSVG